MTETRLLVGSLSNDLFRIATLVNRASLLAAVKFANESKKWAESLLTHNVPKYVHDIAYDVANADLQFDEETAEKYLMYGVLLQNYSLKIR